MRFKKGRIEAAKTDIIAAIKEGRKLDLSVSRIEEFTIYQQAYEDLLKECLNKDEAHTLSQYGFANRLNACID